MAAPAGLTVEEWQVIQHLRHVRQQSANFKFTVYGQGSHKRCVLDVEPAPRIRISSEPLSLAVDD